MIGSNNQQDLAAMFGGMGFGQGLFGGPPNWGRTQGMFGGPMGGFTGNSDYMGRMRNIMPTMNLKPNSKTPGAPRGGGIMLGQPPLNPMTQNQGMMNRLPPGGMSPGGMTNDIFRIGKPPIPQGPQGLVEGQTSPQIPMYLQQILNQNPFLAQMLVGGGMPQQTPRMGGGMPQQMPLMGGGMSQLTQNPFLQMMSRQNGNPFAGPQNMGMLNPFGNILR